MAEVRGSDIHRRSRKPTNNTGMTRDRVVVAAEILSREHGLSGWPLRTLLAELDTSASVIYRLVGDREALVAAVVERVLDGVEPAPPGVSWQQWLRTTMTGFRTAALGCPGTARWLLLKGGTTPPVIEVMLTGTGVLEGAGFGAESPRALTYAVTATMNLVAIGDERRAAERSEGPVDHAWIAGELQRRGGTALSGLADLSRSFVDDRGADDTFGYVLDRVVEGLEVRLAALRAGAPR
ncbi:TetR family transcriptional regulator [Pseudonocardia sp. TMWB2A]|uniref:hypothetical protein n=1 Tax=Pseudonocardia sp. TMWB2A TaxID=687430 RepID=UPI00307D293C